MGAGYSRLRTGQVRPETIEPDPDNAGVGSIETVFFRRFCMEPAVYFLGGI